MKKFKLFILLALASVFICSCSDDEGSITNATQDIYEYQYALGTWDGIKMEINTLDQTYSDYEQIKSLLIRYPDEPEVDRNHDKNMMIASWEKRAQYLCRAENDTLRLEMRMYDQVVLVVAEGFMEPSADYEETDDFMYFDAYFPIPDEWEWRSFSGRDVQRQLIQYDKKNDKFIIKLRFLNPGVKDWSLTTTYSISPEYKPIPGQDDEEKEDNDEEKVECQLGLIE